MNYNNEPIEEKKVTYMMEAIKCGLQGMREGKGGPFGCVIVKNDKIVGRGCNSVLLLNDPTAHAEVIAIRDACKNLQSFQLDDCEIYTSCEPCPMCLGAIYWARPKEVYFSNTKMDASEAGFDDSFIYEEFDRPMENRKMKMAVLPLPEAKFMFEEWKTKANRIPY